jgi:hypothetical protein
MHLVRSGLPISTAVFATSNITIQIHIECSAAHSIPLCFNESRFNEPFPMENPCSESVLASNSFSNSSESGSTQ